MLSLSCDDLAKSFVWSHALKDQLVMVGHNTNITQLVRDSEYGQNLIDDIIDGVIHLVPALLLDVLRTDLTTDLQLTSVGL